MMTVQMDTRAIDRALEQLGAKASDGRIPLRQFYQYFRAVVAQAWNNVKTHGGTFRGVQWPGMKDQYVRKTDGQRVPAEGGVKRVRGGFVKAKKWQEGFKTAKGGAVRRGVSIGVRLSRVSGLVSGKLRPSGKRVTTNSIINVDTGRLRNKALPPRPEITRQALTLGRNLEDWEAKLLTDRPVLFFLPEDQAKLTEIGNDYLAKLAKEFNRAS